MSITVDFIKKLPQFTEIKVSAISNSMFPTIKKADEIRIRKISYPKVKNGSIIAFHIANKINIIVHRVVKKVKGKKEEYFITKGDNNPSEDPWIVTEENFLGKVVAIKSGS